MASKQRINNSDKQIQTYIQTMESVNLDKETWSLLCKNCSSKNIVKHGYNYTLRGKIQRYFCKDCNHNFN